MKGIYSAFLGFLVISSLASCKSTQVKIPGTGDPVVTNNNYIMGEYVQGVGTSSSLLYIIPFLSANTGAIVGNVSRDSGSEVEGVFTGLSQGLSEPSCGAALYNAMLKTPNADFLMPHYKKEIKYEDYFFYQKITCKVFVRAVRHAG